MKTWQTKFIKKETVAEKTDAFYIERPEGLSFLAGQYIDVVLNNDIHTFSIASPPHQKETLVFTTRMRDSSFKKSLGELGEGDEIVIKGPAGQFVLDKNELDSVAFLVGGIGITPARSILLDQEHRDSKRKITLFYSNRQVKDAPFLDELASLSMANFKFVPTMTQIPKDQEWKGQRGHITIEMIKRHIGEINEPFYYIVGPQGFIEAMFGLLGDAGVSRRSIITEEFTGY